MRFCDVAIFSCLSDSCNKNCRLSGLNLQSNVIITPIIRQAYPASLNAVQR
jgi:hypothetical protein